MLERWEAGFTGTEVEIRPLLEHLLGRPAANSHSTRLEEALGISCDSEGFVVGETATVLAGQARGPPFGGEVVG